MSEGVPDKWLDTPEPQPRLGWYKDTHTGRIYFSKSKRYTPKRKFGSTGPRPQKVYWRREDDRAYYEAMYGWTSCWFCRNCSCCCKCYDEHIVDEEAAKADAEAEAKTQTTQTIADTQASAEEADRRFSSPAVADADQIQ